MNKSRKKFRTKFTKQLISGIVHARACLKFFWVKKDPMGFQEKIRALRAPLEVP